MSSARCLSLASYVVCCLLPCTVRLGVAINRTARDAQRALAGADGLQGPYLNEGYEWGIDLDIEKYFNTVNHDKLVSILRERINDATTLHLILLSVK